MFYDRFVQICSKYGVSPSRAAIEAGLSKSTVTKWKNTPTAEPTGTAIKKLAEYFGVSIAELLDGDALKDKKNAPAESGKRSVSDDDIKFALFRGREDITDAMYEEVLNFADYVARREAEKKKKE